ncbi:hypothetical protein [Salipaludibacillus daqingensis]|uniref:hypothetical protein n=1 Tax=Salipaludibacillus daqingensis TaxID=3041001 RepID=UPI0024753887|nr:hypothetical protein [Salipaludibacillus daqingensis]
MNDVWMVGPAMIPVNTVIIFLSFIVGFMYLRFISSYKNKTDASLRDITSNAMILSAVVFYLGSIPLNISTFIRDPIPMISYPSGHRELILGLTIGFIYLVVQHIKKGIKLQDSLLASFIVIIVTDFFYAFSVNQSGISITSDFPLSAHPISLYTMGLSLFALFILRKSSGMMDEPSFIFSAWFLGKWIISLFQPSSAFLSIYLPEHIYLFMTVSLALVFIIHLTIQKKQVISWKR